MASRDELHPLYIGLFLVGGLGTGFGILNLYWSFGWPGGDFNSNLSAIGYSALDNLDTLDAAYYAIPSLVAGLCCLILANATAWKETDGY